MSFKTAKQLNGALLLPAIAGLVLVFFNFEPPNLIIGLVLQSIIIGLVIIALLSKSLSNQKIFGIIPYLMVLGECIYLIVMAFLEENSGLGNGIVATGILCLIGIFKLIKAES